MDRRTFLTGAGSLLMAPPLVRASSLDYVPRGILLDQPCFRFTYFGVIDEARELVGARVQIYDRWTPSGE